MDALLLSLLLCLLLDQNDRSQRLARAIGESRALPRQIAIGALVIAVVLAAGLIAAAGATIAAPLRPEPRLLFFALSLLLGGGGMLWPVRPLVPQRWQALDSLLRSSARLFLARLMDRASFALLGVTIFTGHPVIAALGAIAGGLLALVPPLLIGARYDKVMPLRLITYGGGAIVVVAGAMSALSALTLI